ncbi:amidohydrolase [Enterocloster lavalensis]|uniref:amidohydrolase n=1 Tax=Enterocloster lavalensis TaxID=460384 RepID=UPI0023F20BBA|nr:amidohydrolase [Enterocloster lavalensis]
MDKIEQKIIDLIEKHRDDIIAIGRDIWKEPELGYKEERTAGKFNRYMEKFGIHTESHLAVTGVKGYLKGAGAPGPTVALIGEMDALPMADSPYASAETGAAHCCGHNAQMAGLMGALYALSDAQVQEALDGNVAFMAVPAEEFVEMEFKHGLMEQGAIAFGGGKSELIRVGAFDDIDIAVGHHIAPGIGVALSNHRSNGFMSKIVRFHGIPSHAAEAPWSGVDALSAAALGIQAVNAQREFFRDRDTVRVHGFISKGGEAMNVVADNVTMEYSVRANNIPAILDASRKFDRAMRAGAVATGCGAEIITMPGYLPIVPAGDTRAVEEAIAAAAGDYAVEQHDPGIVMGGSTDFGEVSQILPLLQFNTGGYSHELHNKEMHPTDEYLAYVVTAKVFALTAYHLLKHKGGYAGALMESHEAVLTKEAYIQYMERHNRVETIQMEPIVME